MHRDMAGNHEILLRRMRDLPGHHIIPRNLMQNLLEDLYQEHFRNGGATRPRVRRLVQSLSRSSCTLLQVRAAWFLLRGLQGRCGSDSGACMRRPSRKGWKTSPHHRSQVRYMYRRKWQHGRNPQSRKPWHPRRGRCVAHCRLKRSKPLPTAAAGPCRRIMALAMSRPNPVGPVSPKMHGRPILPDLSYWVPNPKLHLPNTTAWPLACHAGSMF